MNESYIDWFLLSETVCTCVCSYEFNIHVHIQSLLKMDVLLRLRLPTDIISHIDSYVGGRRYWAARQQLSVANAKIDLFSSNWWETLHTGLKWHHWRKRHTELNQYLAVLSNRKNEECIHTRNIPHRLRGVLTNPEVRLLLRLHDVVIRDNSMYCVFDTNLNVLYQTWLVHSRKYRNIVHE
jgi:hypothetical protein